MRQCSLASGPVFKTSNFESSIHTIFYMLASNCANCSLPYFFYFFCILESNCQSIKVYQYRFLLYLKTFNHNTIRFSYLHIVNIMKTVN